MQLAATNNALSDLAIAFGIGLGVVLVLISLSISAVILKLACRTAGAEVPDTGRAMVVSFLESLVGCVAYFASIVTVTLFGKAAAANTTEIGAMIGFSALGIAFVVPAGLYVPMLRVTFSKGLLIAIMRYVITFAIIAVLALIIVSATGKVRLH